MNRMPHLFFVSLATLALAGCGTMRSSVVFEPATGRAVATAPARPYTVSPATSAASAAPARTPIPGGTYAVARGDTLYSIAFRSGVDFRDLAQWNGIAAPFTIWPGQTLKLSPSVGGTTAPVAPVAAPPTVAVAAEPVFQTVPVTTPTAAPAPTGAAATVVAASNATPAGSSPNTAISVGTSATVAAVPVAGEAAPPHLPPAAPPAAVGASHSAGGITWRWPASGSVIKRFNSSDAIPGIEIAGASGEPVRAAAAGVVVYSGNGLVGYGELVIIKHNDSYLSAYGHNRKRLVKEGQRVSVGQQIAEMGSTGASRNELQFQIRKDGNPVDPLKYLPAQ